jgi:1-pyrroline-5-carboxylate dehydrogenase
MPGFFHVPFPKNEPVLNYAPNSPERAHLQKALAEARAQQFDVPMFIGGEEVRTGNTKRMAPPHDHQHTLGHYHAGDKSHVGKSRQHFFKSCRVVGWSVSL